MCLWGISLMAQALVQVELKPVQETQFISVLELVMAQAQPPIR